MNENDVKSFKIVPSKYSNILDDNTLIYFLYEYLSKPLEMKWKVKNNVKEADEVAYVFSLDDYLYRYLFSRLLEQNQWRKIDLPELVLIWPDFCEEIKKTQAGLLFEKMCEESTKRYAMAKDVDYILEYLNKNKNENNQNGNIIIIKNLNK
ncbi:MAG: hypothetical protein QXF76_02685 [Candidatus Anstonellales archaeon]